MSAFAPARDDVVDVVVPLYNNFADAARLFESLQRATCRRRHRLLIVDDASSDTSALPIPSAAGAMVEVSLIRNARNLGFCSSVNAAMRASQRDIVLLNTDTMVYHDWLDRLCAVAVARPRVATVTPLSNAATILSYPTFPREYKDSLEIGWEAADGICAAAGAPPVELPTGVGFCMLITRECLDEVGLFDAVAFRDGYGEESDFCRRAAAAGWLNLAAPNVFVWHRGEGSFGARAVALRERAQVTLRERHPGYGQLVADFIASDPLIEARRRLDVGRLRHDPRLARLHLTTGRPRQADLACKEIVLAREEWWPLRWRPVVDGFGPVPNLGTFAIFPDDRAIRRFLGEAEVREVVAYGGVAHALFYRFRKVALAEGIPVRRIGPR